MTQREHETKGKTMKTFFALNMKSLYGGWTIYQNGEFFAASFPTKAEAKKWAKGFCDLNGYQFVWTDAR